jgi:hypothetical protein
MDNYLQPAGWLGRGTACQQEGDNQAEANKQAPHAGNYTPGGFFIFPLILPPSRNHRS